MKSKLEMYGFEIENLCEFSVCATSFCLMMPMKNSCQRKRANSFQNHTGIIDGKTSSPSVQCPLFWRPFPLLLSYKPPAQ